MIPHLRDDGEGRDQCDAVTRRGARTEDASGCFSVERVQVQRSGSAVAPITINDKNIEVVSSAKLLGLIVSNDLKWNAHIESICKKVATFLRQLSETFSTTMHSALLYNLYPASRRVCIISFPSCFTAISV